MSITPTTGKSSSSSSSSIFSKNKESSSSSSSGSSSPLTGSSTPTMSLKSGRTGSSLTPSLTPSSSSLDLHSQSTVKTMHFATEILVPDEKSTSRSLISLFTEKLSEIYFQKNKQFNQITTTRSLQIQIQEFLKNLEQSNKSAAENLSNAISAWRGSDLSNSEPFELLMDKFEQYLNESGDVTPKNLEPVWQIFSLVLQEASDKEVFHLAAKVDSICSAWFKKFGIDQQNADTTVVVASRRAFSFLYSLAKAHGFENNFLKDFFEYLILFNTKKDSVDAKTFYLNKKHVIQFLMDFLNHEILEKQVVLENLASLIEVTNFPKDYLAHCTEAGKAAADAAALELAKTKKGKHEELMKLVLPQRVKAEEEIKKLTEEVRNISIQAKNLIRKKVFDFLNSNVHSLRAEITRSEDKINKEIINDINLPVGIVSIFDDKVKTEKNAKVQSFYKALVLLKESCSEGERTQIALFVESFLSLSPTDNNAVESSLSSEAFFHLVEIDKACKPVVTDQEATKAISKRVLSLTAQLAFPYLKKCDPNLKVDLQAANIGDAKVVFEKISVLAEAGTVEMKLYIARLIGSIFSQGGIGGGKLIANSSLIEIIFKSILADKDIKEIEEIKKIKQKIEKKIQQKYIKDILFFYESPGAADIVFNEVVEKITPEDQKKYLLFAHPPLAQTPVIFEYILNRLNPSRKENAESKVVSKAKGKEEASNIIKRPPLRGPKEYAYAEIIYRLLESQIYGSIVETEEEKEKYTLLAKEFRNWLRSKCEDPTLSEQEKSKWTLMKRTVESRIRHGVFQRERVKNIAEELLEDPNSRKTFDVAITTKMQIKAISPDEQLKRQQNIEELFFKSQKGTTKSSDLKINKKGVEQFCSDLLREGINVFQHLKINQIASSDVGESKSDVINYSIKMYEGLTYFIYEKIIGGANPEIRGSYFKVFVKVAEKLLEKGELNAAAAVVTSLNATPIERLTKKKLIAVDKKTEKKLENLDLLLPQHIYNKYKDYMKRKLEEGGPLVPMIHPIGAEAIRLGVTKTVLDNGLCNRDKLIVSGRTIELLRQLTVRAQASANFYATESKKEGGPYYLWEFFIGYKLEVETKNKLSSPNEKDDYWLDRSFAVKQ